MIRILLLCFIFISDCAYAKESQDFFQPLKLERVIDGDTIVASGQKIRLWGFDTPEKGHPLYKVATLYLETILAEGGLSCKFIDTDR
jgi:endonuclease YncB( thermonuclease family)